jgi:hypothetical protein
MFDLYLSLDQQKRQAQALDEQQQHRLEIANQNRELVAEGRFDVICGLPPTQPQDYIYWDGYQVGLREYWTKQLGVEIETPF